MCALQPIRYERTSIPAMAQNGKRVGLVADPVISITLGPELPKCLAFSSTPQR